VLEGTASGPVDAQDGIRIQVHGAQVSNVVAKYSGS
jgi:hypothetical protein